MCFHPIVAMITASQLNYVKSGADESCVLWTRDLEATVTAISDIKRDPAQDGH